MTDDAALESELQSALGGVSRYDVILHTADDLVRATQLAASRNPSVAIIDIEDDCSRLRSICPELRAVCPDITLVAAYSADSFSPETWNRASQGAVFVEGVRAGVVDFLRRPLSADDIKQLFDRTSQNGTGRGRGSDLGTVTAFLSNKGGVGKSTLSVNTAVGLAKNSPGDVLLIDASLQMGVCAAMLDLKPKSTLADVARERTRLDTTLLRQLATPHESGLDLIAAPPSAVDAGDIDDELIAQLLTAGRRTYRHVVVDTFPILDGTVISTLDAADLAYVVLENVVPTVLGAARLVSLLDELSHPRSQRRVVLNRFTKVEGYPSLTDVESTLECDVDHVLPFDKRLITAANLGRPIGNRLRGFSSFSRAFKEIVREIETVRPSESPARRTDNQASQAPVDPHSNGSFPAPTDSEPSSSWESR